MKCETNNYHQNSWSYGVLLWEIMSFGETPYQDIPMEDFFTYLEYGHRLKQPENSSHFMYVLINI